MKKQPTFILIFLLVFLNVRAQDPFEPITFDTTGIGYSWETYVNTFTIVENPDKSGFNTSETVGKSVSLAEADPASCVMLTNAFCPFVVTEDQKWLAIDVLKENTSDFAIKYEEKLWSGVELKQQISTSQVGKWVTLLFDFTDAIGDTVIKLTIRPAFVDRSEDDITYFDNIRFYKEKPAIPYNYIEPITFDTTGTGYQWETYVNTFTIVENPDKSGINTSETVAKSVSLAGADPASCVMLTNAFIPFVVTEDQKWLTIDVLKEDTLNIAVKYEGKLWSGVELIQNISSLQTGKWVTLLYDFSDAIGDTVIKLTIRPAFVDRSVDNTTYFDNIRFSSTKPDITATTNWHHSQHKVFPNPAVDFIFIECTDMRRIDIHSISGQKIKTVDVNENRINMSISEFKSGIYFISVITDSGIYTTKLVKK